MRKPLVPTPSPWSPISKQFRSVPFDTGSSPHLESVQPGFDQVGIVQSSTRMALPRIRLPAEHFLHDRIERNIIHRRDIEDPEPHDPELTSENFPDFTEEELDYAPGDLGKDTGEEARAATGERAGKTVRKPGVMACTPQSPDAQYLRARPIPKAGANVLETLKFNDVVFVLEQGGQGDGWYKLLTSSGLQGWVPAASVALSPPTPTAKLYRVEDGDTAIELATRWYAPPGGFTSWWRGDGDDDARFYVAALAFANQGRAGMPSPDDLQTRAAWKQVGLESKHTIWKPDKEFLDTLRDKVSSGSISKELWDETKHVAGVVWDWAVIGAAFHAGLLYGAGESIYDLLAGVVDLVAMVWNVLESVFSGTVLQDARALWDGIQSIDVSALGEQLLQQWNASDPWDKGFFRGRMVGYVVAEIILLVVSFGSATAVKLGGKFAKIGKLIARLPKIQEIQKTIKVAKELPKKARHFLEARFAGRAGKGAKVLKGIDKGLPTIEAYLKSSEHLRKRADAYKRYVSRGGNKSQLDYDRMYDQLQRNRSVGTLAEEQFKLAMGGTKKSYEVTVKGKKTVRYVDNVRDNVAREIKSGPVRLTEFIKQQILKDIQLKVVEGMKVEWHLLAGADDKVLAALKKAGIDAILY